VSLRTRLLVGLAVLATAGLAVAATITYAEQRSFLLSRLNQQVDDAKLPVAVALGVVHPSASKQHTTAAGGRGPLTQQPSGTYGELLAADGDVLKTTEFSYGEGSPSPPALDKRLAVSSFQDAHPHVFTVDSRAGSSLQYRVVALSVSDGRTLVVAVPLREVEQTLHRLVIVELLVGAGVVIALVALGWVVIGVGLRPLVRIGRVASEIANGDLSRRVTPVNQRTEVGRLGGALNEMLGQIEDAFEDRQQSEEQLRRFLADASHELRTPLAAIRGYAELFRLGAADDPEALARAMDRIETEASRMGTLVEDLLQLARLDELPEPTLEQVDLAQLAAQAADDLRAIAPLRQITVDAPQSLEVPAAADQLRQVLANLTRNAVLHTPPQTPIEITVRRSDGKALLEVRDHGPGLPEGTAELVFDRFWREGHGRSRGAGGAGLGLAIVRAIVHAHHGEVDARNAPDGGAVFRVSLPLGGDAGAGADA
jgi:two-component system, OmpR family, sensor kinase